MNTDAAVNEPAENTSAATVTVPTPAAAGADSRGRFSLLTGQRRSPTPAAAPPQAAVQPEAAEADPFEAFASEEPSRAPAPKRARPSRIRLLAILAASIAVAEGAYISWLLAGTRTLTAPVDGTVRVVTRPAGAELYVDGTARGVSPITVTLAAGRHEIELRHGAAKRSETIAVTAGTEAGFWFDVGPAETAAAAPTAAIELTSDPPGAQVTIDGRGRGVTPLVVAGLAPGTHDVVLTRGTTTVRRQVRVNEGTTTVLLTPMAGTTVAQQSGWVRVDSPVALDVYAEDRLIGTSAVDRIMLPAGTHGLRLVNRSLNYDARESVLVAGGQTRVVRPALPTGALSVNALPWAEVWVDGERHGATPIGNLALPIGPHEIVLRHPQLGEQRRAVTVTTGGTTRVGVDLRR